LEHVRKRIWKYAKRAFWGLLGLVLVLVSSVFAIRTYRLNQFAKDVRTPNGIDEAMFVRIGGIDQWVTIRGRNRDNPVLLLLHGGPGNAFQSLTMRTYLAWERETTVAHWDQRGAGKTYGKSGPVGPAVTIDRMALDGVEVADFARRRLGKRKIILVGHSWGSILGVHMARVRPGLFYAYVGTGQIANYRQGRTLAYMQLMAEARAKGDGQAVRALEAIGPPPYDSTSKAGVYSRWATRYEPRNPSVWNMIATVVFDSPVTFQDARNLIGGIRTSEDHFRAEGQAVDLPALGTDFAVPFFVFQGALDNISPAQPAAAYVDSIRAPRKEFVAIPNAGHNAMVMKSEAFLKLLVDRVRPLSIQAEPNNQRAHQ
jgi:pimeloyl-ACP methyl ester carboxylesterase